MEKSYIWTKILNEQEIRTRGITCGTELRTEKRYMFWPNLVVGLLDRPGRYISARPVCLHEGATSFAFHAQHKLQRDFIGLGDIPSLAYAPYLSIFALPYRCE